MLNWFRSVSLAAIRSSSLKVTFRVERSLLYYYGYQDIGKTVIGIWLFYFIFSPSWTHSTINLSFLYLGIIIFSHGGIFWIYGKWMDWCMDRWVIGYRRECLGNLFHLIRCEDDTLRPKSRITHKKTLNNLKIHFKMNIFINSVNFQWLYMSYKFLSLWLWR